MRTRQQLLTYVSRKEGLSVHRGSMASTKFAKRLFLSLRKIRFRLQLINETIVLESASHRKQHDTKQMCLCLDSNTLWFTSHDINETLIFTTTFL